MIIYSICYYYGKNKKQNILNHLNVYKKIEGDKLFIVDLMIDSGNYDEITKEISSIIDVEHIVIPSYNWGGTIVGLWNTYTFLKDKYENPYIVHFEEDFYAINDKWLEDSIELLNANKNYTYIGESTHKHKLKTRDKEGEIHYKQDMYSAYLKRMLFDKNPCGCKDAIHKCSDYTIKCLCVWTDGGYYMTTLNKLREVEEVIGIFHKGNQTIKYHHSNDGVYLGEVGFPTLLFNSGFTFGALYRKKYFIHDS